MWREKQYGINHYVIDAGFCDNRCSDPNLKVLINITYMSDENGLAHGATSHFTPFDCVDAADKTCPEDDRDVSNSIIDRNRGGGKAWRNPPDCLNPEYTPCENVHQWSMWGGLVLDWLYYDRDGQPTTYLTREDWSIWS